jgi:hypothetical protein
VLGEYIAKIYSETKRRPLWLVDYTLNVEAPVWHRAGAPTGLAVGGPGGDSLSPAA